MEKIVFNDVIAPMECTAIRQMASVSARRVKEEPNASKTARPDGSVLAVVGSAPVRTERLVMECLEHAHAHRDGEENDVIDHVQTDAMAMSAASFVIVLRQTTRRCTIHLWHDATTSPANAGVRQAGPDRTVRHRALQDGGALAAAANASAQMVRHVTA